jgi:hypothetical protein
MYLRATVPQSRESRRCTCGLVGDLAYEASAQQCPRLKRGLRHVVSLPTHAEDARDLGHRVPIDLVAPQHLVAHLHQIARVEELKYPSLRT